MSDTIDISGLDKAAVLQALFNASKQQGMGFMHASGANPITIEECREYVSGDAQAEGRPHKPLHFDYLRGRVLKVDLSGNDLEPWGFDRDNGEGAAARALRPLR